MTHRGARIFLGVLTLSLSSCSSDKDDTASTTTEASASTTAGVSTGDPTTDATSTGATTGATTGPTTGGASCPDSPEVGAACEIAGQSCTTFPCQDPCQACFFVECVDGAWVDAGSEVPGTCLDCASVCDFVVLAGCAGGPPDKDACVAGCMDSQAGPCGLAYDQMLFCIGETPTFTCDAATRPTVDGCQDRFDDLYMCLGL